MKTKKKKILIRNNIETKEIPMTLAKKKECQSQKFIKIRLLWVATKPLL